MRRKASTAVGRAPSRMISRVTGCIASGDDAISARGHDVALGHPGALVEQPRGFVERLDIDLDDRRAELCEARSRVVVDCRRHRIAEEEQLARHAARQVASPAGNGRSAPSARGRANRDRRDRGRPSPQARRMRRRRSSAKTETQSSVRQAGTTPVVETSPRLGFSPTMLLSAAGTRPEPAVSVPSASGTSPAATATAEPRARSARDQLAVDTDCAARRRASARRPGRSRTGRDWSCR